MISLEFHCHTVYSGDSLAQPEQVIAMRERKAIDRLVITDHNTIAGARACQALDPDHVIVGEEIMTTAGELLAAYVVEEIPAGLPPLEAIRRLKEQGAFISVSHPFDFYRKGHWSLANLLAIAPHIDAIEVFNARCIEGRFNRQAAAFAQAHSLAGTAGSDAHAPCEMGRAYLRLPEFDSPESLRQAVRQAQVVGKLSPFWVHLASRYAVWRKMQQK